ncbi:hypothetical protein A3H11_02820 [Candidatus Uhrbacteria bacterium RIFCSPLOWO2_12_FULL_47_10]|nr:MAG: hypothetical protein A2753_04320 [Candidatus Uhrbacteria bacterium RIFCSPHIGHO2_01_FULL_47_11]OGL92548.1 MAG: hypothetical protein A3H11_02820 [Candidatus Uhrbacteria bacterium RIFCSPLOWO2_12_FULL_47_10]
MKQVLRKFVPKTVLGWYHLALAKIAAAWYWRPSEKMVVIGVTGTNGKSTTVNLIARILEEACSAKAELLPNQSSALRHCVGLTSTVNFKVGEKEWLNPTKMTMLGRFALQKLLRDMVDAGCKYAVVETSSEGIKQYRHRGINYDVAVFTNLTPEHIESHGGFENYKKAKGELFRHLTRMPRKPAQIFVSQKFQSGKIPKISVVNGDDQYAEYFLQFPADGKWIYGLGKIATASGLAMTNLVGHDVHMDATGSRFVVDGVELKLKLLGEFDVYNALAAIAVARALGVDLQICKTALEKVEGVPGRLERIDEGQNFTVIVDYAPEPASLQALYRVVKMLPHNRVIHVLGSTGGGRDRSRRGVLGKIAAKHADTVIVTNEDPYDDDPMEIIEEVARGARECKMKNVKCKMIELLRILDRKEAIAKALSLAQQNDLVLITGKGAEQAMCVAGGKKIPWDDREVVKTLLSSRH